MTLGQMAIGYRKASLIADHGSDLSLAYTYAHPHTHAYICPMELQSIDVQGLSTDCGPNVPNCPQTEVNNNPASLLVTSMSVSAADVDGL